MRDEYDLDAILSAFNGEEQPQEEPALDPDDDRDLDWAPETEPETEPEPQAETEWTDEEPAEQPLDEAEPPLEAEEAPRARGSRGEDRYTRQEEEGRRSLTRRVGMGMLSFVLAIVALVFLGWSLQNLHPASGSAAQGQSREKSSVNIAAELDPSAEPPAPTPTPVPSQTEEPGETDPETQAELPEPTPTPEPEKIHYTIPEDALSAPAPDPKGFHTVSLANVSEVMDVIEQARADGLLGKDETTVFNPDIDFYWDSNVEYYYDETILTICWKEVISGNTCSLVETRIADASQLRRKLAGDAFGSQNQFYATELAREVNSVVAMNADYYLFRDFGIVVYDGQVYRFNTATYTGMYKKYNCVETCFVDSEGDFLFNSLGEEGTMEGAQQFVDNNGVRFSISFGPVLVQDGQVRHCDWYPVGEIDKGYSRAGIGQVGKLHYLYMSVNHEGVEARWTVNTFAQHFGEKGVINAYCLDGGQTGEIVFQGRPFNHVDFGAERLVSDIIYFATAIPEEVRS